MRFSFIVATDKYFGIGRDGGLAWNVPKDMAHFKKITTDAEEGKMNAVIMGRKTWESIPERFRPLKGRLNIILSRTMESEGLPENTFVWKSISDVDSFWHDDIDKVFVIGGEQIYGLFYRLSLSNPEKYAPEDVYHTLINKDFDCSHFFISRIPKSKGFTRRVQSYPMDSIYHIHSIDDVYQFSYTFHKYPATWLYSNLMNTEEKQYLDIVSSVLTSGSTRGDRTGTGTLSQFGKQLRFSLEDGRFPLLSTKKTFFRGAAEELLFFLRGYTDNAKLKAKKVHIWDGNTTREYLDSRGLSHYEEDDLGPAYGWQWRHYGAEYKDKDTDYTGQGHDQVAECLRLIKEEPTSRRILFHAWNVSDLSKMCLPPCHIMYQFYVTFNQETGVPEGLSCMMTQRSADLGLGVPFNIATTALLTCIMAAASNLSPKEIIINLGDAHVYSNHIDALKEQIKREPLPFPELKITKELNSIEDIEALEFNDFEIRRYFPHPAVRMKMAV